MFEATSRRWALDPFSRRDSTGGPSRRCRWTAGASGCAAADLVAGVVELEAAIGELDGQLFKRMPGRSDIPHQAAINIDAVIVEGPVRGSDWELGIVEGPPRGSDWELVIDGGSVSAPFLTLGSLLGSLIRAVQIRSLPVIRPVPDGLAHLGRASTQSRSSRPVPDGLTHLGRASTQSRSSHPGTDRPMSRETRTQSDPG